MDKQKEEARETRKFFQQQFEQLQQNNATESESMTTNGEFDRVGDLLFVVARKSSKRPDY